MPEMTPFSGPKTHSTLYSRNKRVRFAHTKTPLPCTHMPVGAPRPCTRSVTAEDGRTASVHCTDSAHQARWPNETGIASHMPGKTTRFGGKFTYLLTRARGPFLPKLVNLVYFSKIHLIRPLWPPFDRFRVINGHFETSGNSVDHGNSEIYLKMWSKWV